MIGKGTMGDLMAGKRGLIMGVANHNSIAWGAAKALAAQGAEIALTYQGEAFGRRVRPLADEIGCKLVIPCDVEDVASLDQVFATLKAEWGSIDFVLHAIAFSDKSELKGLYADTTRENFTRTMLISCFSFTEVAKRASEIMQNGGSMVTMSYGGAVRVMPNYNVMGVAKAALEASVRYLAADFGPRNIRINAVSAGPVRTLAGAGVSDARLMFNFQRRNAPMRRNTTIEEVGGAVLYLMSELANGVTGEIHYVDSGYNVMSMPSLDELKAQEQRKAIVEGDEIPDDVK
jgi:enoyl-[acyl-carrier protein] reductase I